MSELIDRAAFLPFVALTVLGIYLLLAHRNFLTAVVGLYVFQTAIILFFIIIAVRAEGTIPIQNVMSAASPSAVAPVQDDATRNIADDQSDDATASKKAYGYDAATVMHNPLPHALMLTAIVVGVATQGVALALLRRIRSETGSIEDTDGMGGEA